MCVYVCKQPPKQLLSPTSLLSHTPPALPHTLPERTLSQEAAGLSAAEASVQFGNSAAAFGAALLLLWFAMGAIYCMCNMPFKQDTLLYGRSKAD